MWNNFIKALLTLIVIVSILPNFYKYFIHEKVYDSSAFDRELAQLTIQEGDSSETNPRENEYRKSNHVKKDNFNTEAENFIFNPNTASADEWSRLGIPDKTIATINIPEVCK